MPQFYKPAIAVIGILLPVSASQATIQTDLEAGLPLAQVIDNALNEDQSLQHILDMLLSDCESRTQQNSCDLQAPLEECVIIIKDERAALCDPKAPLETCNPSQFADEYRQFKFKQMAELKSESCSDGELQAIGEAMIDAGMPEEQLIQQAINSGVDPTAVLPPAATGTTSTEPTISPPPFGTNQGDGGGGAASPS